VRGVDTSSQLTASIDWIGSNKTLFLKKLKKILQGFASRAHVPSQASLLAPPAYALYHYHHGASYGGDDSARAAWQQLQCGSKGTGVFIPRSTPGSAHPKKKGKSRGAAAKAARPAGAGAPPRKRV
jgi:hypothetical protein